MKTILQFVRVVGVLAVAFSSSPSRAQTLAAAPGSQAQGNALPGFMLRGSDVMNAKVFSEEGEELGRIRDVLLDPKTGQISFAVVGTGGWQGIGEKFTIVPWKLVTPDEQKSENYVLHTDVEKFRAAPIFERDHWATVIQPEYLAKVQKHYAAASQPQQAKSPQPTPAAQPTQPPPQTAQTSQPTTPTPRPTQPERQTAQKSTPEPTPARQAEQRPRKEPQVSMKPRHSSGNKERVGTDGGGSKDDDESQWK